MKKTYLFFRLFLLALLCVTVFSCQKEEEEHIDETEEETISASSALTNLLLRTSQNSGKYDDIIDNNSCTSIVLPITVVANGQQVTVNTPEDINEIEAIFNLFPNDTDTLEITFPITLKFFDYSETTVNNKTELDALAANCDTSNLAIDCVNFVYPASFFTYNLNNQQTGTVTITDNWELFMFLYNLESDDIISLNYPVSLQVENNPVISVNSNQELQTVILDCVANTNDDPIDISQFEQDLSTGIWYVDYFFDDYDETDDYAGYEFTFALDGTAQSEQNGVVVNGTWALVEDLKLNLFFGNNEPLAEFNEDWEILEANSNFIKLKNISGDGSTDYLTFGREPNTGNTNTELNLFIENLITGSWYVNLLEEEGIDYTTNFNEYEFTFFANGSATAVNDSNVVNGYWTAQVESNNLEIILNFDTATNSDFEDLNDDWSVVESSQIIIKLIDESNGGSSTNLLTFGREPNGGGGGGPNAQELRDILETGTWYVEKYLDDGDDETADFYGFDFNFYNNETVFASNGSQYVYGIWIVTVSGQELNFEFDMDSPLNRADDQNYKALQYSPTSVTFITRNSQGEIEDTLVFKQN